MAWTIAVGPTQPLLGQLVGLLLAYTARARNIMTSATLDAALPLTPLGAETGPLPVAVAAAALAGGTHRRR